MFKNFIAKPASFEPYRIQKDKHGRNIPIYRKQKPQTWKEVLFSFFNLKYLLT